MNDLVERYVYAVTKDLPKKIKVDVKRAYQFNIRYGRRKKY